MPNTPVIEVGIQFKENIQISFSGNYILGNGDNISGKWDASIQKNTIRLTNKQKELTLKSGSILSHSKKTSFFTLHNVTIGINFHWERNEDQSFKGSLKLIIENDKITAINIISIEDYLLSVISSEMSATSSMELLKAHAVISRSWMLAQIEKNRLILKEQKKYSSIYKFQNEIIKWYDREDHENFDVCADDHCQRYQGITKSSTKEVEEAIKATWGEVLMYDNEICDARFSKCCGGMVEVFENVWEPVNHPYLQKLPDYESNPENYNLALENENNAEKWILGTPEAFCNTSNKKVLSQVLNDYDQETNDFYRWKVEYTQQELNELVKKRTGIDFGTITDLIPVERGASGRLIKLKIAGSKKTLTIGKELEIRKTLSESHLYSSAFVVEKNIKENSTKFILIGAGWGHGVGLCQIGAAMMSENGYSYKEILKHYYKKIKLERRY